MWWAVCLEKGKQAIHDRWCAGCLTAFALNEVANADGDPAAKE